MNTCRFCRWRIGLGHSFSGVVTQMAKAATAKVSRDRGERLQIMLSAAELALVDDFRFKKRMPSRAAAVRELFKRGLAAEGFLLASPHAKSSDFGVAVDAPGKSAAGAEAAPGGSARQSPGT